MVLGITPNTKFVYSLRTGSQIPVLFHLAETFVKGSDFNFKRLFFNKI